MRDTIRRGSVALMLILGGIGLLRLFEAGDYRNMVDAGVALATL